VLLADKKRIYVVSEPEGLVSIDINGDFHQPDEGSKATPFRLEYAPPKGERVVAVTSVSDDLWVLVGRSSGEEGVESQYLVKLEQDGGTFQPQDGTKVELPQEEGRHWIGFMGHLGEVL